jgi:hypothetical protein
MAYIGRDTDKISNVEVLDNITFDGSSSYTLQKGGSNFTPSSANTLLVSIDGVVQAGNFTVSGSTIDFGTAVAGTSTCDFILHYGIGLITTPSDGTVTTAKLADSSVSLAKLTATGTKDATTFLRGDNTFAEAGGGKVLQVVQTVKQDMTSTSSTSYVDISGMSVSITPSSVSSKILILCTANTSTNNTDAQGKLLRDSTDIVGTGATNNATMYLRSSNGDTMSPNGIIYLDSPNTTSAVTYKLQWKVVTDTVYLNRRMGDTAFGTISTIIAMEISA